jgi:hypothetical protein
MGADNRFKSKREDRIFKIGDRPAIFRFSISSEFTSGRAHRRIANRSPDPITAYQLPIYNWKDSLSQRAGLLALSDLEVFEILPDANIGPDAAQIVFASWSERTRGARYRLLGRSKAVSRCACHCTPNLSPAPRAGTLPGLRSWGLLASLAAPQTLCWRALRTLSLSGASHILTVRAPRTLTVRAPDSQK